MPGRVVPLCRRTMLFGLKALIVQRVDGTDRLSLGEIYDCDRAVAHARQIEKRILHEGELLVLADGDVMRAFGSRDRFDELRFPGFLLMSKMCKWPGLAVPGAVMCDRRDPLWPITIRPRRSYRSVRCTVAAVDVTGTN